MLIFDLTKKSPDFLIRALTYTLNQKSISIFISLELRASSLSFSVLFSSGMSSLWWGSIGPCSSVMN